MAPDAAAAAAPAAAPAVPTPGHGGRRRRRHGAAAATAAAAVPSEVWLSRPCLCALYLPPTVFPSPAPAGRGGRGDASPPITYPHPSRLQEGPSTQESSQRARRQRSWVQLALPSRAPVPLSPLPQPLPQPRLCVREARGREVRMDGLPKAPPGTYVRQLRSVHPFHPTHSNRDNPPTHPPSHPPTPTPISTHRGGKAWTTSSFAGPTASPTPICSCWRVESVKTQKWKTWRVMRRNE